jgi:hypothetical protein
METTTTPEGLVRRTITKDDRRFLNFYNEVGEDQPLNPDAEPEGDAARRDDADGGKDAVSHV